MSASNACDDHTLPPLARPDQLRRSVCVSPDLVIGGDAVCAQPADAGKTLTIAGVVEPTGIAKELAGAAETMRPRRGWALRHSGGSFPAGHRRDRRPTPGDRSHPIQGSRSRRSDPDLARLTAKLSRISLSRRSELPSAKIGQLTLAKRDYSMPMWHSERLVKTKTTSFVGYEPRRSS